MTTTEPGCCEEFARAAGWAGAASCAAWPSWVARPP